MTKALGRHLGQELAARYTGTWSRWAVAALTAALLLGCVSSKSGVELEQARLAEYILDEEPDIRTKLGINFDDKVELIGYEVTPSKGVRPGGKMKLVMYWRVKQKLDSRKWLLFTHILDANAKRILNIDNVGPLRSSPRSRDTQALPPGYWEPGKIYVDKQVFRLPKKIDSDKIQIVAGIWRDKDRLPIRSGPSLKDDRGLVTQVKIKRSAVASARVPELKVVQLPADQKITIDGKLDEPAWAQAADTGAFVDVSTGEAAKASPVQGNAKLLWSNERLFVGFTVKDPDIVGGFPKDAKDPHLWTKDTVEIMVDPDGDGDNKDYYEIQVGPQNLVFDSQFDDYNKPKKDPDGPFGHQDWSAQLSSAVTVQGTLDKAGDKDTGYTVEISIPWSSFGKAKQAPPKPGDTWRINLYAMQDNGGVSWSPILRQGNFHKASRFGKVQFVTTLDASGAQAGAGGAGAGGAGAVSGAGAPSGGAAAGGSGPGATLGGPAGLRNMPRRLQNPLRLKRALDKSEDKGE